MRRRYGRATWEVRGRSTPHICYKRIIRGLFVCMCMYMEVRFVDIVYCSPRWISRTILLSLWKSYKKIDKGQTHLSQLCPLTRLLVGSRPITAHQINLFGVLQFVRFGFSGGTILFNCCSNRTGSSIFLG